MVLLVCVCLVIVLCTAVVVCLGSKKLPHKKRNTTSPPLFGRTKRFIKDLAESGQVCFGKVLSKGELLAIRTPHSPELQDLRSAGLFELLLRRSEPQGLDPLNAFNLD